jgi:hypothetical protein
VPGRAGTGLVADAGRDGCEVRGDLRAPGHAGDPAGLGEQVARADHHLARYARPVRALPAHQLGLHADDVQSGLGQASGDVLAAHPHADDDHVDRLRTGVGVLPGTRHG